MYLHYTRTRHNLILNPFFIIIIIVIIIIIRSEDLFHHQLLPALVGLFPQLVKEWYQGLGNKGHSLVVLQLKQKADQVILSLLSFSL